MKKRIFATLAMALMITAAVRADSWECHHTGGCDAQFIDAGGVVHQFHYGDGDIVRPGAGASWVFQGGTWTHLP